MSEAARDLPRVTRTPIPGLLVVGLDVRRDPRGYFKENWQRAKMVAAGLPDFTPVQHNVSFNERRGVTRGIHAEPWDKFVSVVTGKVFGAWVDLREGPSFGAVYTHEIEPDTALFVPRGVGNAYQVLSEATTYSYLVTRHWRPDATYTELNLADPVSAIAWPIPLDDPAVVTSEKDRANPTLGAVSPMPPAPVLVVGAAGQVGRALVRTLPGAVGVGRDRLDITNPDSIADFDFSPYAVVVNAAAYTAVDAAETPGGRVASWAANATGPALLARVVADGGATLVHFSSDYVFDGAREPHTEQEPLSPLGVYGQSKAAGDAAVTATSRHYLLRTSWVIGDGANFVRTMRRLADQGACPSVVDDQVGRLTFADEIARAVAHLLQAHAPYGVYNLSNGGEPRSWAGWAREVFAAMGRDAGDVTSVSTAAYASGRVLAPRPPRSTLALDKLAATGFVPEDGLVALRRYLGGSTSG